MSNNARDIKNFQNPREPWVHDGPFFVELTPDADLSIVPRSAEIHGHVVCVYEEGRVKLTTEGIKLYSQGSLFSWGNQYLKVIRNGSGNLLWVNYHHR